MEKRAREGAVRIDDERVSDERAIMPKKAWSCGRENVDLRK